jgi:carbon storage regulator CsrA
MLILSRKAREGIRIGRASDSDCLLTVTVLEIKGSSVKLGFEAAAKVPIQRWEIWERLHPDGRTIPHSKS